MTIIGLARAAATQARDQDLGSFDPVTKIGAVDDGQFVAT